MADIVASPNALTATVEVAAGSVERPSSALAVVEQALPAVQSHRQTDIQGALSNSTILWALAGIIVQIAANLGWADEKLTVEGVNQILLQASPFFVIIWTRLRNSRPTQLGGTRTTETQLAGGAATMVEIFPRFAPWLVAIVIGMLGIAIGVLAYIAFFKGA